MDKKNYTFEKEKKKRKKILYKRLITRMYISIRRCLFRKRSPNSYSYKMHNIFCTFYLDEHYLSKQKSYYKYIYIYTHIHIYIYINYDNIKT